jgi:FlaA1/EpsC-like NDP-sugar epimerase
MSIVSDILPILLALSHDDQVHGDIDVGNKGTVSLQWIEQWQTQSTANTLPMNTDERTDLFETWTKTSISPETRQIYQAAFLVPTARKTLEQQFQQQSIRIDSNASTSLLVTGGCGFIGSTFINYWLETYPNDRIVNIDRLDPVSNTKNIVHCNSSNYSLVVADISNKDIILHLMNQYHITHVVHFAGYHTRTTFIVM